MNKVNKETHISVSLGNICNDSFLATSNLHGDIIFTSTFIPFSFNFSTVLSVVIYKGSHRITNSTEMKAVFGNGAYLQWRWLKLDDESYGIISASDPRFGNGGFTFTLSPDDVDTKVTFECKLML